MRQMFKKNKKTYTPKKSEKSEKNDVDENGVAAEMVPEKILGATDDSGQLKFLIKWRGVEEGELIVANEVYVAYFSFSHFKRSEFSSSTTHINLRIK